MCVCAHRIQIWLKRKVNDSKQHTEVALSWTIPHYGTPGYPGLIYLLTTPGPSVLLQKALDRPLVGRSPELPGQAMRSPAAVFARRQQCQNGSARHSTSNQRSCCNKLIQRKNEKNDETWLISLWIILIFINGLWMRMLLTASFFKCIRILRPALGQMSQTGHLNRHAHHVPAIHSQGTWKKERQRCMDASDIGCSADKVELPAPPCVRTGKCRNLPRPPGRCWWLEAAAGDHPPGSHKLQVSFSSRAPRRTVR